MPDGKDMVVTEENKMEYVEQMVRWRVDRGVAEQMQSIVRGFHEVWHNFSAGGCGIEYMRDKGSGEVTEWIKSHEGRHKFSGGSFGQGVMGEGTKMTFIIV